MGLVSSLSPAISPDTLMCLLLIPCFHSVNNMEYWYLQFVMNVPVVLSRN